MKAGTHQENDAIIVSLLAPKFATFCHGRYSPVCRLFSHGRWIYSIDTSIHTSQHHGEPFGHDGNQISLLGQAIYPRGRCACLKLPGDLPTCLGIFAQPFAILQILASPSSSALLSLPMIDYLSSQMDLEITSSCLGT